MAICPYCKTEIDDDAIVCKNCTQIVSLVFDLKKTAAQPPLAAKGVKHDLRHVYLTAAYFLMVTTVPLFILNHDTRFATDNRYSWSIEIILLYTVFVTALFEFIILKHSKLGNVIVISSLVLISCTISMEIIHQFILEAKSFKTNDYARSSRLIFVFPYVMTVSSLLAGFIYGLIVQKGGILRKLFDFEIILSWVTSGESLFERGARLILIASMVGDIVYTVFRLLNIGAK